MSKLIDETCGIKEPLVSVLICTYNCEPYIKNTLQSVIDQKYENIEILIRDNGSSDSTPEVLEKFSEKHQSISIFLRDENIGPYNGLNFLLDLANGKYIAIQDHDDIWHPEKLNLQIKLLESTEYNACGGLPIKLFEGTNKIGYVSWDKIDYYAPHPSLVFVNGDYRYDPDITYKGDMYFMKYILSKGEESIYNIQKPLYISLIRSDENNLSEQWTSPPNILNYYWYSGEKKYLLYFIFAMVLPKKVTKLTRKYITQNWKYDNIKNMRDDEFETKYMKYIQNYTSDPITN